MQKRILSILIALLLVLPVCLSACSQDPIPEDSDTSDSATEVDSVACPVDTEPTETEFAPVVNPREKNLTISRLNKPITVEILDGVTVDLNYQGWPSICRGDGETLYAVSSLRTMHVDPYGSVAFTVSENGGKTWSQLRIIMDTPLDDRDPYILYLGDGHLMVTWFTHNAVRYLEGGNLSGWRSSATAEQLDAVDRKYTALSPEEATGGAYVMHSTDGGETWGDVVQVPVSSPHGATLLNDGETLLFCGTQWFADQVLDEPLNANTLPIFRSTDGGYTWEYHSEIRLPFASPPASCEPNLLQCADGSFLVVYRCETKNMSIYISRSEDGKDWTIPVRIGTVEGGPPTLLQLDNGVIVLTYGYRVAPSCGIRALISDDGGKTWSKPYLLALSENSSNWDLGYPTSVQMDDGTILTAYYGKKGYDSFCSFLYTKWTLEERIVH